jgi:hypothetical protein
MMRWEMPSSPLARLDAARKRADELRAKGKVSDRTGRVEPYITAECDGRPMRDNLRRAAVTIVGDMSAAVRARATEFDNLRAAGTVRSHSRSRDRKPSTRGACAPTWAKRDRAFKQRRAGEARSRAYVEDERRASSRRRGHRARPAYALIAASLLRPLYSITTA